MHTMQGMSLFSLVVRARPWRYCTTSTSWINPANSTISVSLLFLLCKWDSSPAVALATVVFSLDSPDSPYLKHDSLKISFCVGVFSYHHVPNHQSSSSSSSTVDLKQLLWVDEFVYLRLDDKTYCAAKSLLAARCPTVVDKQDELTAIAIPDMVPYIFKVAFYFVFLDSLRKIDDEAIDDSDPLNRESFAAAHWFGMEGLKRISESSLSEKVSRDSVVSLLHLAHHCNAAELKSACLEFAARNRSVIMESDECQRNLLTAVSGFGWFGGSLL